MAIINGKMLLILEIEQIKEYEVFKDYGKTVYDKDKIIEAPNVEKLQFSLFWISCSQGILNAS